MTAKQFETLQVKLKLTDAELAEQLGVRRETVWGWRTGKAKVQKQTELAMFHLESLRLLDCAADD